MEKQCNFSSLLLITLLLPLLLQCLGQQLQTCTGSQRLVICVTNNAQSVCEQPSNVTTSLARVYRVLNNSPCITLHFTGGLHVLENELHFGLSYTNIEIEGINSQTIIESNRNSLTVESGGGKVVILNVVFKNCSAWMTLYFQGVL